MSRVRIVATIGPRSEGPQTLRALHGAGMDVARLNGSHGDPAWHARALARLREVLPAVPVLLDLPGSKVRTLDLMEEMPVAAGERVVLTADRHYVGREKVPVDHPGLPEAFSVGDTLLVDDGTLRLTVRELAGRDVCCRAENAAVVRSRKGVQARGLPLRGEFLSDRARALLALACEQRVDYVGLSFVETPAQVEAVRMLVGRQGPGLVAKIETPAALHHLEGLLEVSDALLIDRGDLAVETDLERIALVQRQILARARRAPRPVIVATQMLHSMMDSPLPTKAEISDITHAVLEGAAALMLSGETAVGRFPVEAVALMRRVAEAAAAEPQQELEGEGGPGGDPIPEAVADAIALLCRRLRITKVVVITLSGYAGRALAARMPRQPILAVSNDPHAARRFTLFRGTKGIHVDVPFPRSSVEHIPRILRELWRRGEVADEDLILVTAVSYPHAGNRMNLIETHHVADLRESLGWTR